MTADYNLGTGPIAIKNIQDQVDAAMSGFPTWALRSGWLPMPPRISAAGEKAVGELLQTVRGGKLTKISGRVRAVIEAEDGEQFRS
jgi:hypothetical protein